MKRSTILDGKWHQVGGDMNPQDYGCVLARYDAEGGYIEFHRVQSTVDYVGIFEAAEVGRPFWHSEMAVDVADLDNVDWSEFSDFTGDKEEMARIESSLDFRAGVIAFEIPDGLSVHWEELGACWGREVLPCKSSEVNWWAGKMGHAWRTADAEYRETIRRGW